MAEETELSTFGNFSIQDTMEMGMGNQALIDDLISPETQTEDPNKIEKIIKEVPKLKEEKKIIKEEEPPKEEKKDLINDLLGEDVEKEEATSEETPQTEDLTDNRFTALSNDLFKLNVFTKDEGEADVNISTPEEFLERFNSEKKKGAIDIVNNFIGQFGEDYQEAFQAIFVKGANPKEYFNTYNSISNFSELDLTKEENQIAVIKQGLHNQGFENEDIDTEIERLKNYGDVETVAAKHHKVLIKNEAQKLQGIQQKAEQELQQKANIKAQYVSNVQGIIQNKLKDKEFDGIPISPKIASELQDFLLVDKYKTSSGETLTDFDKFILEMKRPENHEMKVKVALLLKVLEKDPTLSTIQRTGITKKSNELFSEVARQKDKTLITNNKETPKSWFA